LELVRFGPLYALIRYRIGRKKPLDPDENWRFWTRKRGPLARFLIDHYPPGIARKALLQSALSREHASGIEYHYDLPTDFFRQFLDREFPFYSCADFSSDQDALEQAQRRKAEALFRLIQPKPGERILDLGCGWGGMMKFIAGRTGDRKNLYGYTISQEQYRYIRDRLDLNVQFSNFITADYDPESWDKIYSIGAFEHVRPQEFSFLLSKLYRALKPGGLMVHQFFCLNRKGQPGWMIAGQIFFPGSLLISWEEHLENFRQAGFSLRFHSTHDYRPTLKTWYRRLVNHRKEALRTVDSETYNRFLIFFPVSWRFFDENRARVHRVQLCRP